MKIRTITTGIPIQSLTNEMSEIERIAEFNLMAKDAFERRGYEVQTIRIATNSWEDYFYHLSTEDIISELIKIEEICQRLDVSFFNIGYANTPTRIAIIPEIIKNTIRICTSSKIGDNEKGIDYESAWISAKVIKDISEETENGYGNFRFCSWANCKAGIPFFPASFHDGSSSSFAIGLECGDFAMKAFSMAKDLREAERCLKEIFEKELNTISDIAFEISAKHNIDYRGIDPSLAPSLDIEDSIAYAYEKLGIGKFGNSGTLAISSIITKVLKDLSVKTCGYSGLMLPVCEDAGLAERANEGTYSLTDLLLYSAVCGCGCDTIPIPGDVAIEKIQSILLDMASLAIALDKPLIARLLPIPGKKYGELTAFDSPYLIDCKIFHVK
ncbi:MAG: DUF711 family protein [Spirochaetota bacterium]|nr:DUF711 family protein [Spirochaetota bacterium]